MPSLDLGITILIIDDSSFARKTLAGELKNLGFTSFIEADGFKQAVEFLKSHEVGLIMCDHLMPGFKGTDLLHKLRRNHKYDSIPFILVTGHSSAEVVAEVAEYGGDAMVVKPFSPQTLQERINQGFQARAAALTQNGQQAEVPQMRMEGGEEKAELVKGRVRVDDSSPKGLLTKGLQQEKEGHFEQAIALYEKALEVESNFILAHKCLANLYVKQKKPDLALTHLDAAVRINPSNHQRRFELVELLIEMNKKDKAIEHLTQMVHDDRCQYPELLTRVSQTLSKLGQEETADKALEKILEVDAHNPEVLRLAAERFASRKQPAKSARALKKAHEIAPQDQEILYDLSKACQDSGDENGAQKFACKLLELNPDHAEARKISKKDPPQDEQASPKAKEPASESSGDEPEE